MKVGTIIRKNSKQGGGAYTVIGLIKCERGSCGKIIPLREVIEPTKAQKKKGRYYQQYAWCPHCGLYQAELYMYGTRQTQKSLKE